MRLATLTSNILRKRSVHLEIPVDATLIGVGSRAFAPVLAVGTLVAGGTTLASSPTRAGVSTPSCCSRVVLNCLLLDEWVGWTEAGGSAAARTAHRRFVGVPSSTAPREVALDARWCARCVHQVSLSGIGQPSSGLVRPARKGVPGRLSTRVGMLLRNPRVGRYLLLLTLRTHSSPTLLPILSLSHLLRVRLLSRSPALVQLCPFGRDEIEHLESSL